MTTARFLALSATLLVVVTLQATAGADMEAAAAEEPMEISWFGPFGGEIQDGNQLQTHIEENFNVKLVNKQLWRRDREKYKLLFASGEEPDAGYMYVTPRDYYMQGVFRSIPKEMIEKHVPSMAAWLDSMGPAAWMYGLVPGKEDEYMGLVRSYDYAGGVSYFPVFRLDWLEQIDMAPADLIHAGAGPSEGKTYWTKTPYTFAEFEKILYAFRNEDLDGNGMADTIPYAMDSTIGSRGLHMLLTLFALNNVDNYNDGGKAVKMAVHPNLREALQVGQRWYQDGIIDSELPTVSKDQRDNKVINGLAGAYTSAPVYVASGANPSAENWLPQPIYRQDAAAKVVMTPVPIGPDGTHTGYAKSGGTLPIDARQIMFMVSRRVDDAKLAKILDIVEYLNWDREGRIYSYFGQPGVHFNWSGEPFASPVRYTEEYERGGTTGILYYPFMNFYRELHLLYVSPEQAPLQAYFGEGGEGGAIATPTYREDLFSETDYSVVWAKYAGALDTIRDEFIWEAITTDLDIDAAWDGYMQKWLRAGGSEVNAEMAKMPIVAELRKGNVVY